MNIATLKLSSTDDIPEYLKINKTIYNKEQFAEYLCDFFPYSPLFFEENRKIVINKDWSSIEKLID